MKLRACMIYSEFPWVAGGHWSQIILPSKLQQVQWKWCNILDWVWESLFTSSPEITALVKMWLIVHICSHSHTGNEENDWGRGTMNLPQLKSWTDWKWPSFTKSELFAVVFSPSLLSEAWQLKLHSVIEN